MICNEFLSMYTIFQYFGTNSYYLSLVTKQKTKNKNFLTSSITVYNDKNFLSYNPGTHNKHKKDM